MESLACWSGMSMYGTSRPRATTRAKASIIASEKVEG
jgi:hypothetical protein